MAQKDLIIRCGEDGILWQTGQESNILLSITRFQILFMRPVFNAGFGWLFRDPSGSIQIMIARYNYLTFFSYQIQAGGCIPFFPVRIVGIVEAGDIPQAYAHITTFPFNLFQDPSQSFQVFVDIRQDG